MYPQANLWSLYIKPNIKDLLSKIWHEPPGFTTALYLWILPWSLIFSWWFDFFPDPSLCLLFSRSSCKISTRFANCWFLKLIDSISDSDFRKTWSRCRSTSVSSPLFTWKQKRFLGDHFHSNLFSSYEVIEWNTKPGFISTANRI